MGGSLGRSEDVMKFFASQRFLAIYSSVLALVFLIAVICGSATLRNATFG
jgi:hypothetical protein